MSPQFAGQITGILVQGAILGGLGTGANVGRLGITAGAAAEAGGTRVVGNVITGYTRHGLNQALTRDGVGVSPSAILNAVRNPASVTSDSIRGSITYLGENAVVVLNRTGKVITTYATDSRGWRTLGG